MSAYILIVDHMTELSLLCEAAVSGAPVRIVSVGDSQQARRALVQDAPECILCRVALLSDTEFGFRFCGELREHAGFATVPVLLVADEINDDVIRKGSECGASGMVARTITHDALRKRLSVIAPGLIPDSAVHVVPEQKPKEPEPAPKKTAPVPTAQPAPSKTKQQTVHHDATHSADPEMDAKLKLVQNLLAKVLHNLKTSDLLQIADLDDVPSVVYEMTRSICGIKGEAKSTEAPQRARPASQPTEPAPGDVQMNLDSLFKSR